MNKIEEFTYYNDLLDIYGELLSDKQKNVLEEYYRFNLSLLEISEEKGITRSAVLDAINKGKKHLDELENTLHIHAKTQKETKLIDEYKETKDEGTLQELERTIKNGIWIIKWKISEDNYDN